MTASNPVDLETDPRFCSGPWVGFFFQHQIPPGKHWMELQLEFRQGAMQGAGRDFVGPFLIQGTYDLPSGTCHCTKHYLDRHAVYYRGFNEGKGIWGTWEIPPGEGTESARGGYHIWPKGMPDPSQPKRSEAIELPAENPLAFPVLTEANEPAGVEPTN